MKDHVRRDGYRVKVAFFVNSENKLPVGSRYVGMAKLCSKSRNSDTDESVTLYYVKGTGYGVIKRS